MGNDYLHLIKLGLRLRSNRLGDKAAVHLATVMREASLLELDLSGNCIRAAGAAALAESLGNSTLKKFYLGNNGIGSQGGIAIAKAAAASSSLEELGLENCSMQLQASAQALAEMIQSNGSLRKVDISHNRIPQAGIKLILEAWKNSPDLTHLGLDGIDLVRHLDAPLFAPFNHVSYYYGVVSGHRCVLPYT